ncbi:anti-sigma factor domain-containing protein [Methylorubrum sp. SB2]|uniref:anti-sigma factor n=1 Tax=Methylorubrum subtropicum TaxID=3138812 RepID=UPI00313C4E00
MTERESDDARGMRAAEYVLGTLDAGERAAFELERTVDPATEAALQAWERRLAPLARAVPPVAPSPELWGRIAAALPSGGAGQGAALPSAANDDRLRDLVRKVRFWRRATVAAGAAGLAAAGLALALTGSLRPTPPGGRSVAVVTSGGDLPALVVSVDATEGTVRVRPLAARTPEGRSLELWSIDAGAAPRPLGLVGTAPSRLALPPEAGTLEGATLAVSVEPPGGSPTGQPTGPVIYSGKLIPE